MALDKLVDGTQLDGAMTAMANAIRVKTRDNSSIPWDFTTGFANAISTINNLQDTDPGVIFIDYDGTILYRSCVRASYCHLILDHTTEICDNVHPTNGGYNKMALEICNQINCWQNGV